MRIEPAVADADAKPEILDATFFSNFSFIILSPFVM
jgi:hypothetical protein